MTEQAAPSALGRRLAIIASVVVVATVVTAIVVTGTPSERREVKLDNRRVDDLERIATALFRHYRIQGSLPANLGAVPQQAGSRLDVADPVTGVPYEYATTGPKAYRLCAVFTTDTAQSNDHADSDWYHGIGRQCFDRNAAKAD